MPVGPVPEFKDVQRSYKKSDAILLDRHSEVIHELRVDLHGRRLDWEPIRDISPALIRTMICSEDRRFYQHHGVDWKAISAALMGNVFSLHKRGASTITMQIASLLDTGLRPKGSRRTVLQKWRQIRAAQEIEKKWTKEEIIEAYLNLLSFRGELVGISAASRGLFGKEPWGLNDAESLVLAALIRSPNAPVDKVIRRACRLAASEGSALSCKDIERVAREHLGKPYAIRQRCSLAPHVARALLKEDSAEVMSTLDARLQRFAFKLLNYYIADLRGLNVRDGAVLVVDNPTGEVLAYVANTGRKSSAPYVDGIQAKRQAGSTLKPFLYGLAFERHLITPASLLEDEPLDVPTPQGIYSPENYDNYFRGMVTARVALASSLNIPAVRTLSLIGVDSFIRKLKELGFNELRDGEFYGLSLALGTADVSLWELVNAYRTFANRGVRSEATLILNKMDLKRRVFSKEVAFIVSSILSDREARSSTFSLENPLSTRFWTAVKTGTSKDMMDNWCVGYSERYTVGVWIGNFSGEPMWDVTGMTGAAPIWFEIMNYLHRETTSKPPIPLAGVVSKNVLFSGSGTAKKEFFIRGVEPEVIKRSTAVAPLEILYPPPDAIIALDPDIPSRLQKLFFESTSEKTELCWMLDGVLVGHGNVFPWFPERGFHTLALLDSDENFLDEMTFQVR
ncbi:MAG: penicillin-binding protein 1C [Deltaproteobacteria bacterium]|nr:penicillin-binding protein 1C [Deltaproteobacteria bacterium]